MSKFKFKPGDWVQVELDEDHDLGIPKKFVGRVADPHNPEDNDGLILYDVWMARAHDEVAVGEWEMSPLTEEEAAWAIMEEGKNA